MLYKKKMYFTLLFEIKMITKLTNYIHINIFFFLND